MDLRPRPHDAHRRPGAPADVLDMLRAFDAGQPVDRRAFERRIQEAVNEVVAGQIEAGIDVVTDGECAKPSFNTYILERLGGFEVRAASDGGRRTTGPVDLQGRHAQMFPDHYRPMLERSPYGKAIIPARRVCTGPIRYIGHPPSSGISPT